MKKNNVLTITDKKMTRFNISLQDGCQMVFDAIEKAWGGEIFVPKIPSYKIVDVAKAIGPKCEQIEVGIRPGEKLHEIMCPADDSHLTLDFPEHYVIRPSITFTSRGNDFTVNGLGEEAKTVDSGFVYDSGTNSQFLSVEELRDLNREVYV